jgi:hypothetical protein
MRRDSHTVRATRALEIGALLVAVFATGGCLSGPLSEGNAAQPHLDTKIYSVSCEDGRRYAAQTLKVRTYEITDVQRNASQTTVTGRNTTDKVTSSITVTCQEGGVTVATNGGTQWVKDGLRFGFYQLVETGDRIWPPPTGPVVKMELYQGAESKIEFPTELDSLGLVGVRVKVLNAGERTLRIDPRRLIATAASGAQAHPIAQSEAQQKVGGSDPDIAKKLLGATKLKQGESVVGFVFFPAGSYESASIALIDDKTSEADDYDVHFGTG